MHVVIADIELEAAQAVAQELNGTPIQLDVARPDEVAAVADRIYRDHGAVHLLCNNAGVAIGGHLSAMTHDDWRWMISVNIEGVTNRSEEHTSELQSLMRIQYAVFCLKKKTI